MLGAGKISMVLTIAGWLAQQAKTLNRIRGLFTCPNVAVLYEVGRMLYSQAIPFAFVTHENGKLIYSWSAFADEEDKDFVKKRDMTVQEKRDSSTRRCAPQGNDPHPADCQAGSQFEAGSRQQQRCLFPL